MIKKKILKNVQWMETIHIIIEGKIKENLKSVCSLIFGPL